MLNLSDQSGSGSAHRLVAALAVVAALWSAEPVAQISAPEPESIAAWLADDTDRPDTLLAMAVLARFQQRQHEVGPPVSVDTLRQDRAWLTRLESRFGASPPHSPVLDPAAWLVHLELDQHQLQPNFLVSTAGPGLRIYLDQVFDRSDGRLASVMLPELLWQVEPQATLIWIRLLEQAAEDEALRETLAGITAEWFADREAVDDSMEAWAAAEVLEKVTNSLAVLAVNAVSAGPPDQARLKQVRYALLAAMPSLDEPEQAEAKAFLRIAGLIDGLHDHRYFAFAEGLLAVVTDILLRSVESPGQPAAAVEWLSGRLPGISANFARSFAGVDPRLNSALAAAFDVVQNISRAGDEGPRIAELRRELADAVAQLALFNPDLDYYFELPVRDPIAGGVDACTGMMAQRNADGTPAMTRDLFDDCQESLVNLADIEARAASLSGDSDGPFGAAELQRELSVTSGQRINYGIGYLHKRYSTGCEEPARPLPNPLEWSALATLLAWFAEQSPVYFQTPENEARLLRMRAIGYELLETVGEQVDCFAGAGASLNDPVSRSLADYRAALVMLGDGLGDTVVELREQLLRPGADIALQLDAYQPTAYRPDDLMIGPCDPVQVCEMSGELSSTRALLGLFPDLYLVADQSGLGKVEICYDNIEWVRRRTEQVRPDDTNVANYFGYLSFDLVGRYLKDGGEADVFGFRFTSPDEQHYLFAAATDDVLNDSCPMEWVGSRIVTPLRGDRIKIVPDRLTYLATPRMLPSRLLSLNWDRGAEWRDWFITGIGVDPLDLVPPEDISGAVTQHLQSLYRTEQAAIYDSMQRPASRSAAPGPQSLFEEMTTLTTTKALIRMQMMLFYPQLLMESDDLRSAVAGQRGLLDSLMLARFRENNVPVSTIEDLAVERLERFQIEWRNQAEATLRTGSVASSMAHALMRLNALYQEYFAPPSPGSGNPPVAIAGD